MKRNLFLFVFSIFLCASCASDDLDLFDPNAERNPLEITTDITFVDPNLVPQARDLYYRLQALTQQGIAFGQQEAIGGGVNFFNPDFAEDSDFSRVTNDQPAIIGFDLEGLELIDPRNPNPSIQDFRKKFIQDAHENGSIITISWHAANPITRQNSFNRVQAVPQMLENGTHRAVFMQYLERLAAFFNDLKDTNGNPIPVLFRPWHEMNGDFFYWGEGLRTTEEFIQLYRDTIRILTEDFNVHNLIYIYSPNWVSNASEYLRNYPGDAYVDMLGIDVYDFKNGRFLRNALQNLQIVEDISFEKNMLFALTETGLENVTQNDWWTERLYKAIRSSGMTYAMIWRNATANHFHAPYLGHPSEENFKEFVAKETILLRQDIQ
ncbi:glycoside hydrolase family 26 protein [Spongiimicrobium salis]|uniref:glycoside hydrolase family 26 protein n=1 Tax=Spongiimicrobium salis TaxID=1667022 RepID=UPI00374CF7CC